jgi:hypothetical protein
MPNLRPASLTLMRTNNITTQITTTSSLWQFRWLPSSHRLLFAFVA